MARRSLIVANDRRAETVQRYRSRRDALRRAVQDPTLDGEQRLAAARALSRLPRDSSPVRVRNRDRIDGRPRGFIGKTGLSRINFRTAALRGELPGITKSSW